MAGAGTAAQAFPVIEEITRCRQGIQCERGAFFKTGLTFALVAIYRCVGAQNATGTDHPGQQFHI
jgi:hypothetical protein